MHSVLPALNYHFALASVGHVPVGFLADLRAVSGLASRAIVEGWLLADDTFVDLSCSATFIDILDRVPNSFPFMLSKFIAVPIQLVLESSKE